MKTRQILVIDDDESIRETIGSILTDEGYEVIDGDGIEALDKLRRGLRPAFILLDLMMPEMDGWEFRAQQLHDPELALIPVVVISGDGHAEAKAAALQADSHLRKPFELSALLAIAQDFTNRERFSPSSTP
jgi:CheY-like chemotaxis protein